MINLKKPLKKIKNILGLGFVLAKTEFKLRNEGSYLGIFWYLLNPILTFGLLLLVFGDRLGNNIREYPLYLLMGVIMFNFFQSSTIESTRTIIKDNVGVIKSINFPRESLILSIVIKNFFSHFFEMVLFAILLAYFHISLVGILYYFFILFFFCLFIFGVSLTLSSSTVYLVDIENIWSFAVRLLWLGTPIFYAIAGQTKLLYLNLFNPMYYFLTAARDIVIYAKEPDFFIVSGMIFFTALSFVFGVFIFNILKTRFAERM